LGSAFCRNSWLVLIVSHNRLFTVGRAWARTLTRFFLTIADSSAPLELADHATTRQMAHTHR